MQTFIVLHTSK